MTAAAVRFILVARHARRRRRSTRMPVFSSFSESSVSTLPSRSQISSTRPKLLTGHDVAERAPRGRDARVQAVGREVEAADHGGLADGR